MRRRAAPGARPADRILAVVRSARDVANGTRADLEIVAAADEVPAIFLIPHAHDPVPAVLLLHGLGSRKERMADTIGMALMERGVAALAVDLPLHGGRDGVDDLRAANPMLLLGAWGDAMREARVALGFLAEDERTARDRLGILGYSLGSFLANVVAAEAPEVQAVVLAASGDLPQGLALESAIRSVLDPLRAVRRLSGRPLLMINGRYDRTVTAEQAERLFAAAPEPRTMRWYGGGHWPPPREIAFAADWLAEHLLVPQRA